MRAFAEPARRRVPRGGRRPGGPGRDRRPWPRRDDAVRRRRRRGGRRGRRASAGPPSAAPGAAPTIARVAAPPAGLAVGHRAPAGRGPRQQRRGRPGRRRARRPSRVLLGGALEAFTPLPAPLRARRPGGRRPRRGRPPRARRASLPDGVRRRARRSAGRRPTAGRRCARARPRRPATSASTRSASAARSSCAPACTCSTARSRRRTSTSASARRAQAEVVRIVWPNGILQSEFNTAADATIAASQRLKGSCPWLFAWNGREMGFVTDLIWRSPLGLRINAQATADASDDRGLGEGPRRPAGRARRRLRPARHRRAVGDALLRPRSRCWSSTTRRAPRSSWTSASRSRRRRSRCTVTGPVGELAGRARRRRRRRLGGRARARRPASRLRRPRRLPGHHARPLRRAGAAGRGAAHGPALAGRAGLGPSDRQLDQRRDRPGQARAARAASRCRSPTRPGASARCATGSGFPSGKDKTVLIDLDGRLPASGPPARAARHEPRGLLGPPRLGGRTSGRDASRRGGSRSRRPTSTSAGTRSRSRRTRARPSGRATCWPARARAGSTSRATTRGSATCGRCSSAWTTAT